MRHGQPRLVVLGLGAAVFLGGCQRGEQAQTRAAPATAVDQGLLTKVLEQYVNEDGLVDYRSLKANRAGLDAYVELLGGTDPTALGTRDDRLAYWINAYNAVTIQYVLDEYPLRSVRDVKKSGQDFWKSRKFTLGGKEYVIDAIENEVIRPRFQDPRVHFVLVCAARGCPILEARAFTGDDLQARLDAAAKRFLNDSRRNRVDRSAGRLYLSSIFKWYSADFEEAAGSVRDYVKQYLEDPAGIDDLEIEWLDYDWSLNEQ